MAPFVGGLARGFPHGRGRRVEFFLSQKKGRQGLYNLHGEILTSFNPNIIDTLAEPWNNPLQPFLNDETKPRNVEKQSPVMNRISPVSLHFSERNKIAHCKLRQRVA